MSQLFAACIGLPLSLAVSSASAQNATRPELRPPAAISNATLAAPPTVTAAPQQHEPPRPVEKRWYGWQTLASDAASTGLFLAALGFYNGHGFFDSDTPALKDILTALSVAGYLGGAPTLHVLHHRPLNAVGSVGLRLGLPAVGGLIGAGSASCPPAHGDYGNCGASATAVGLGAGIILAVIIDASVSWEKPKPEMPGAAQLGLAPVFSSDGKRGELRMFGTL